MESLLSIHSSRELCAARKNEIRSVIYNKEGKKFVETDTTTKVGGI